MIPHLAAVYSQSLIDLLTAGDVSLDRIVVCPRHTEAQLQEARSHRPLLLHEMPAPFALNRSDPFDPTIVNQIKERAAGVESPWLSTGLIAEPAAGMIDAGSRQSRSQVYLNVCRNALRLKQQLPVPLLLANPGCRIDSAHAYACEPLFITAVLDAVDCGFSLDVAHARTSARHLGFDEERYFRSLPLFRVRELQVSGPRPQDNAADDARKPLREPDWRALSFVLARTKPEVVVLSYTQDRDRLRDQLRRLQSLLQTPADHRSAFH
jgi:uncharacterized protein (UPF0276 family)